jgi:hypothetical protein
MPVDFVFNAEHFCNANSGAIPKPFFCSCLFREVRGSKENALQEHLTPISSNINQ